MPDVLIYRVTVPINCKCILPFVTFHLLKRILRHQANKNCRTYFSSDGVSNNVYETAENNSEKTFFLYTAFELLFLQQNYLFQKISSWFPWSNL